MGYLDNSTIVVDAVLTKEGRKKLAAGASGLDIRFFTLSDSGVDYRLWNPDHPSGSAYYGEAIENLPSLEAVPRGEFYMRNKLITLDKNITALPYWTFGANNNDFSVDGAFTINDTTDQEEPGNNGVYLGVDHRFTFNQASPGLCLLVVGNQNMFESITAQDSETSISAAGSYEGLTYTSLQNLEAQAPVVYQLNTSHSDGAFNLNFKRATLTSTTSCDCTLIDTATGIYKSFQVTVEQKLT